MNKMMQASILLSGALILSAALSSCVSMDRAYPEKRFFVIDASREAKREPAKNLPPDPLVWLREMRISPAYEGKGFVYRTGAYSYETDFYNEFFLAPGVMLHAEVREWLDGFFREGGTYFSGIVDSPHPKATFTLQGAVNTLYGDYSEASDPKAVLAMQFIMTWKEEGKTSILFHKDYRKEVALECPSPEALAEAWSEALAQILKDFEQYLGGMELGYMK
jgi:cholesterol transport system auxiliary component